MIVHPHSLVWRTRGRPRVAPFVELGYPKDAVLHLGGMPGAGKSTFARRLLGAVPVFSPDDFYSQARAERVSVNYTDAFVELFSRAAAQVRARAATPIVIENTAAWTRVRSEVIEFAQQHGRACHLLLLDVSARACAQARAGRADGYRPPADVVSMYVEAWEELLAAPEQLLSEGYDSVTVLDRRSANRLQSISFQ